MHYLIYLANGTTVGVRADGYEDDHPHGGRWMVFKRGNQEQEVARFRVDSVQGIAIVSEDDDD